jgi:hypothetical protein
MEAPQKPSSPTRIAEQSKVVPKHDNGVEDTEAGTDLCDGTYASIANARRVGSIRGLGRPPRNASRAFLHPPQRSQTSSSSRLSDNDAQR